MNRAQESLGIVAMALAFTVVAPGTARAGGPMVRGMEVAPASDRLELARRIADARGAHPEAFDALARVRARLPALDRTKRGAFPLVTPQLVDLGKDALFPMLEALAVRADGQGDLSDSAWTALRAGLLEAVGKLRDERAVPVLIAVVEGPEADEHVVRAAAGALGRIGTDAAVARLVRAAKRGGEWRAPVVAGLGTCHRAAAATALAQVLASSKDEATLRAAADALGTVASSWAWQTSGLPAPSEHAATRATAARALVATFVAQRGEVRDIAAASLSMVDDPATPSLLREARATADPETARAIDALLARR